ncbi:hypothetical protein AC579_2485 [Pseudocercospora musae]|uniref:Uncharacterized protein n=1 Tax=Pseudocercospora musae TaxID=113226 RepID=A0A139IF00_9PEZI|nr:hypothetical protein AC579_2485 [Pseudocercospora musae]
MHHRHADGQQEQEPNYRLDTAIETNDGRLSLDLNWNTQPYTTLLKDQPKHIPDTASDRPGATSIEPDITYIKPDITYIKPNTSSVKPATYPVKPATSPIRPDSDPARPDSATLQPAIASSEEDIARPLTPVENKRDSRHLPEIVCFPDTPIPAEANFIDNNESSLERNASKRITFMQTGLDFGSAVDLHSSCSASAEPSPGFSTEFHLPLEHQNSSQPQQSLQSSPQPRQSFQYSPQPWQSFQYSPQPRHSFQYPPPRVSFQSNVHPFYQGRPPSYRSPSPIPVYLDLQRHNSVQ